MTRYRRSAHCTQTDTRHKHTGHRHTDRSYRSGHTDQTDPDTQAHRQSRTEQPAIEQPVQALALPCLVSRRLSDQRLTHQAYDEAIALDGAHALLQLEQDLVLVLDVAALRLRVGERGPCGEASVITARGAAQGVVRTPAAPVASRERRLEGILLLRTHDHVELSPARLRARLSGLGACQGSISSTVCPMALTQSPSDARSVLTSVCRIT
eukprot:scaffold72114_cov58-Phaeocystis_antarctica.AAC.6